jgi:putative transcriptional regulator
MIKYHPEDNQLKAFVAGELSPALALVVSAHIDMCEVCQHKAQLFSEELAKYHLGSMSVPEKNENSVIQDLDENMQQMFDQITALPPIRKKVTNPLPTHLEFEGRRFALPRALQRYASKTANWSPIAGRLWQAPVDMGLEAKATFFFLEKDSNVPEHTHRGNELTLVIDGEFSDGLDNYSEGDLILMDRTHTHSPHSQAEEGCLVFSIVDAPLHFTSGLARLLNPFSHLFY